MAGSNPSLRQWLGNMSPWQCAQYFDDGHILQDGNLDAKNWVKIKKIVGGRTHALTVYIDYRSGIPPQSYEVDLRNMQCECKRFQTLQYPCVHEVAAYATFNLNKWKVQSPAFEMFSDRSLRRKVKGRMIMRIQNDMDIRKELDPKCCIICRTTKCPHGNAYNGQSS
ncbi:hypothetical protein GOBAR_DD19093 [Gossypium barbadense]|nr:hypothetical protein GOBAR_DD19093 [Gossypium barbadense]